MLQDLPPGYHRGETRDPTHDEKLEDEELRAQRLVAWCLIVLIVFFGLGALLLLRVAAREAWGVIQGL